MAERNERTFDAEQDPDVNYQADGTVVVEYTPKNANEDEDETE